MTSKDTGGWSAEQRKRFAELVTSMPHFELPEDLRVPLHCLQADVRYFIARVAEDTFTIDMVSDAIRSRLSQIEEAAYYLAARVEAAESQIATLTAERDEARGKPVVIDRSARGIQEVLRQAQSALLSAGAALRRSLEGDR